MNYNNFLVKLAAAFKPRCLYSFVLILLIDTCTSFEPQGPPFTSMDK